MAPDTTRLYDIQPLCRGRIDNYLVTLGHMLPSDPQEAGQWAKSERVKRGLSAADVAGRINEIASAKGDPTRVSQQVVSKFEQANNKRLPPWTRFIADVFAEADDVDESLPHLHMGLNDASVSIKLLPTWAGMGTGGTGDDDPGVVSFSRDLVERELRANPDNLLAMQAEGNSMEPDFRGGDQILVDTRRTSLAQPGAFCLFEDDGHVIKYLERVPESEPPRVRVVSLNPLYEPRERLLDDIRLIGRVIWFGRRVQ